MAENVLVVVVLVVVPSLSGMYTSVVWFGLVWFENLF